MGLSSIPRGKDIFVKTGLAGYIKHYPSMGRASYGEKVNSSSILVGLRKSSIYRHRSGKLFSYDSAELLCKLKFTQEEIRKYGTPVLTNVKTGKEYRATALSSRTLSDIVGLSGPALCVKVSKAGSRISDTYRVDYLLDDVYYELEPWHASIKYKKHLVYVTDLKTNEEFVYANGNLAATAHGLSETHMLRMLAKGPGYVIKGRYKIGCDSTYTVPYVKKSNRVHVDTLVRRNRPLTTPVRVYDVISNTERSYVNMHRVHKELNISNGTIRAAVACAGKDVFNPKYRMATDQDIIFKGELSFDDVKRIGGIVLRDRDGEIIVKADSITKYSAALAKMGICTVSHIRSNFSGHLHAMSAKMNTISFPIDGVEFYTEDCVSVKRR